MRNRTVLVAAALLVGVSLFPAVPGGASDRGGGCGRSEPTSLHAESCVFMFRGTLQINASASDPTGGNRPLTLRVWVHEFTLDHSSASEYLGHETTLIVECSSSGRGFVACQEDWPTGDRIDFIHPVLTQQGQLACHVEADVVGSSAKPHVMYSCVAGIGT